jgi:polyribonucleotide 5'-hydroxyl-kinase
MVAPDSALPIGAQRRVDETELLSIDIGDVLLHCILAVSNAELPYNATKADEACLPIINLAGFVYVSEVDERKKRIKLLCPNPGKLPKRYLWLGSLRWAEM